MYSDKNYYVTFKNKYWLVKYDEDSIVYDMFSEKEDAFEYCDMLND